MGRPNEQSIKAILPAILRHAQRRYEVLSGIQQRWSRLVGKQLAAHSQPVSLRRGRLVVHVDQPGDGFMLSYRREQLLERLRTTTKGNIEELVIRPGELRSGSGK